MEPIPERKPSRGKGPQTTIAEQNIQRQLAAKEAEVLIHIFCFIIFIVI